MKTFMDVEEKNLRKYLNKKAQPKRIYVVAPNRRIFIQWCAERGIHWNNPNVTHMNRHELWLGITINPQDEVAFVAKQEFDPEHLKLIEHEITMRTRKNEEY